MKKFLTTTIIVNFLLSIGYFIVNLNFAEFNCVGGNYGGYLSTNRCNVPNVNNCYCKLFGSTFLYDITGLWLSISIIIIIIYVLYLGASYIIKKRKTNMKK
jgi:hypothetical protein